MESDINKNLSPLSIRKLDLETDFPLLYEWIRSEYLPEDERTGSKYENLLESYKLMEESNFAEAYMLWQDDKNPVMEVDIYEGEMDEIHPFYDAQPHDYIIRIKFPPQRDLQLIENGVKLICQYCFAQKEAQKVIVPVFVKDDFQKKLLTKLGFSCYSRYLYKNIYSLYVLAR